MQLSDAIYQRIKYYMKLNNAETLWDLYKITGVPKSTINSLFGTRKTVCRRAQKTGLQRLTSISFCFPNRGNITLITRQFKSL